MPLDYERVVDDGLETALILEDDVDWHMDVKHQFARMSTALGEWRKDVGDVTNVHPYGTQWDMLWVGQCGEVIPNVYLILR